MLVKSVGISCVHVHKALLSLLPLFSRPFWYSIIFHCNSTPVVLSFPCRMGECGVSISHTKLAYRSLWAWQGLILQDAEHLSLRARESKALEHLSPQWEPAASVLEGLWGQSEGSWLWQSWRVLCSFRPRGLLLQFGLFACLMDTAGSLMEIIVMLMEITCLVAI